MSPLDMTHQALEALSSPGVCGVVLVVPKGGMPRGFPRGELLNEVERGGVVERVYSFPPMKVLEWLVKNQLVELEKGDDGHRLLIRASKNAQFGD